MSALIALAKQDAADRRFAAYAADMVWLVASRLSRGRLELDPPSRFAMENGPGSRAREDTRSGREIIGDLKEKLLGGTKVKEERAARG